MSNLHLVHSAEAAAPSASVELYAAVHKGLRYAQCRMLVRLGSMDLEDEAEVAEVLADLRALLSTGANHLRHEDDHIHPALEARAPGGAHQLGADHDHHHETFARLAFLITAVEVAGPGRAVAAHGLYLAFSRFMAEDFAHMAYEEEVIQPLLQGLYSNPELEALHGAILASLTPEELAESGRVMIPAARPQEREMMVAGVLAGAPAEAHPFLINQVVRYGLDEREWGRLARSLGLPIEA